MNLITRLKRFFVRRPREPQLQEDLDGSLRGHALRRAKQAQAPRTGTPYDYEDYEAYQASLERLQARIQADRETS